MPLCQDLYSSYHARDGKEQKSAAAIDLPAILLQNAGSKNWLEPEAGSMLDELKTTLAEARKTLADLWSRL